MSEVVCLAAIAAWVASVCVAASAMKKYEVSKWSQLQLSKASHPAGKAKALNRQIGRN